MKSWLFNEADNDFAKARNMALINEIQHFFNPDDTALLSFQEAKELLKPHNEVYKGMQTIPVDLIVGSEGRYRDFDNHFFPKHNYTKNRWLNIDMAHLQNVNLPPIRLYELGELYFVRDGNHRVSVARSRGVQFIDAEVTSLQSEIKIRPGRLNQKALLAQVLAYEKRLFYAITAFGDITDCWNMDFSAPGRYDVIYNHIIIHKYYINQNKTQEISMVEAVRSWYDAVYLPIIKTIERQRILKCFRGRTASDLYVWVVRYWDDLKKDFGNCYSLDEAARDFKSRFTKSPFEKLWRWLKSARPDC
ncbi:MAG: transcriptional regulator [Treponema sp.]|jgi:hypothetical protein|nr:transcriptional regulator [Treponema sp.]